jgi:sugar lactone lactonase YvrE
MNPRRSPLAPLAFALLPGCTAGGTLIGPDGPADDDGAADDDSVPDDDDTGTDDDDSSPGIDCSVLPPLPAPFEVIQGPIHSEDFAFDDQGHMVSSDDQGNLVKSTIDGDVQVWVPNVPGAYVTAGMSFLPDGTFAFADAGTGTIYTVAPSGAYQAILSGLNYPNGLETSNDGYIYVSENGAGRVRRVDPETGDYVVLAEGLYGPNGVTFSPDGGTLYVGSFGGGTVHRIPLGPDGATGEAELWGWTPGAPGLPGEDPLAEACGGLAGGDSCSFEVNGDLLEGSCTDWGWGYLSCYVADPYQAACEGLASGDACEVYGQEGECYDAGGGGLWCSATWVDPASVACDGLDAGDSCTVYTGWSLDEGECADYGNYLYCETWTNSSSGGLDGIGVDVCGNVYVTEYVLGLVWRIPASGGEAELAATLPTSWIPNMDWGSGLGGWDDQILYVIDRTSDLTYSLDVGLPGRPRAFP